MTFTPQFLTNAVSSNGIGIEEAIRLLEKNNGRPDMIVRARTLREEQRRAALRAAAANDDQDDRMAA